MGRIRNKLTFFSKRKAKMSTLKYRERLFSPIGWGPERCSSAIKYLLATFQLPHIPFLSFSQAAPPAQDDKARVGLDCDLPKGFGDNNGF